MEMSKNKVSKNRFRTDKGVLFDWKRACKCVCVCSSVDLLLLLRWKYNLIFNVLSNNFEYFNSDIYTFSNLIDIWTITLFLCYLIISNCFFNLYTVLLKRTICAVKLTLHNGQIFRSTIQILCRSNFTAHIIRFNRTVDFRV